MININKREKEALDVLIKKMDKEGISYTFKRNRLIINHHIYTIGYIIDGFWHLSHNKKQVTLNGNKKFWSFLHITLELVRGNYSTLNIYFK